MSLYVALDLLVIAAPVAFSFERRIRFVRRWPAALVASILVGIPYCLWDAFMTRSGAWSFDSRFAGTERLLLLPPGELLFFVAIPFACLFLFEAIGSRTIAPTVAAPRLPWVGGALLLAAWAGLLPFRLYTTTDLAVAALFLLIAAFAAPALLASARFWATMLLSYLPFLAVNGVLTALPVVRYAPSAILGPRIWTIPIEDFLYSFALLGFNLLLYELVSGGVGRLARPQAGRRGRTPVSRPTGRSALRRSARR